jgi:hypothetical protein
MGREDGCKQAFGDSARLKRRWEDLDVDGRIILYGLDSSGSGQISISGFL